MHIVLYFLLSVISLYLSVYYANDVLIFLFLCTALIPLLLLIPACIAGLGTRLFLHVQTHIWEKGSASALQVHIKSRVPFSVPELQAKVVLENTLTGSTEIFLVHGEAPGGRVQTVPISIKPGACGLYKARIRFCRGRDYLHIFPIPIFRDPAPLHLIVLPTIYESKISVSENTRRFVCDSDTYDPERSGEDPCEIYDLHPYRTGDDMRRIHWKISARTEIPVVKEFGQPLGYSAVIFLALWSREDWIFDALFTVSQGMLNSELPHYISWYCPKSDTMERAAIGETQDLFALAPRLFQSGFAQNPLPLLTLYREKFPAESFATTLEIGDGIWKNQEQLFSPAEAPGALPGISMEI